MANKKSASKNKFPLEEYKYLLYDNFSNLDAITIEFWMKNDKPPELQKSHWGFPFTHNGVDFHPTGGGNILSIPFLNATEGWDGLSFSYLLSKISKVVRLAPYKQT